PLRDSAGFAPDFPQSGGAIPPGPALSDRRRTIAIYSVLVVLMLPYVVCGCQALGGGRLSQAFRGTKPVSVCFHGVPEMIRCIKREIPPERFRPTSAMGTPAWSTPRPSCATRFARLVACRLMSS